jgi:glutamate---cysteine ligase / carboxylate-amine ligase
MGAPAGQLRSARAWAAWQPSQPYTIGLEEEVMLLDPEDWSLAQRSDDVLPQLPAGLTEHVSAETHQGAIELATDPHATVGEAVAQLAELRAWLADELAAQGLAVAAAGTHPFALWSDTRVSPASRYQVILRTMADLARREPTFALHVHVGVPDADRGIRLLNQMRAHVPLLLGLSANSPFWQGRSTGLASTRTPVFGAFPRTGLPRRFHSYEDWVATVDGLLRCGAFPEPTFLWWDIRPQPALGTVEIRVMDAQTDVAATAALVALVQSIGRLELEEGYAPEALVGAEEILAENRFLAARDGIEADLLDPAAELRRPARAQLRGVLDAARPHADALGCRAELDNVARLALEPPFLRQLDIAERRGRLPGLMAELAAAFVPEDR